MPKSTGVEILQEAAVPKEKNKTVKKVAAEATDQPKASRSKKAAKPEIENRPYSLEEALQLVKKNASAKFDETIEAHFRLSIDPAQSAQNIRGNAQLPHGTGRPVRVLVFASGPKGEEAKAAGAVVADDKTTAQIEKGAVPFDIVIATPEEMPKIAKLARVLGVRGLMPNPKTGTVTTDIAATVAARSHGLVDFKNDQALVHTVFGKASFSLGQLKENFLALFQALKSARPAKISGEYIRSVTITSTMGPGLKLDLKSIE